MIFKKLFVNLLVISTSLESTNLKMTIESDQSVSLPKQLFNLTIEKPQEFGTGINKIEHNIQSASSQTSGDIVCNFTNNEIIGKRVAVPFKNLLIKTLTVLDGIFYIYEGKQINIEHYYYLGTHEIFKQINGYVNYLHQSVSIAPIRDLYFESAFARYLIHFKNQNSFEKKDKEQLNTQLYEELKWANIQTLFNTLLFAIKDSEPKAPTGVITCVLLMLFTLKTDNNYQYHQDFLIYLIIAHKRISSENFKTDSESKFENIQKIRRKIYKKMCMTLFPEIYNVKCKQIDYLTEKLYVQNYWFNEFSVVLLMHYINGNHLGELDYIFRELNNYEAKSHKKKNESVDEYFKHMVNLFYIEKILLDRSKTSFVSYLNL